MSDSPDHNPPDVYHDEKVRAEVGGMLKGLPLDHPARIAYRLGQGPIALSRLVDDEDLAKRLKVAFLDGYNRMLRRYEGGFKTLVPLGCVADD